MMPLEWIMLISASVAVFSIIMFFFFLVAFLKANGELKKIEKAKPKKRKRRRRWRRKVRQLKSIKKTRKRNSLIFLSLLILSIGIGGYSRYYQQTNMTEVDTENIVSGYYLIDQVEQQLEQISKDEEPAKQADANIHNLAIRIASFASKRGSSRASEEGQFLLNRYYARMGQFGVNLASEQVQSLTAKPEVLETYHEDIKGIKKAQKELLNFYKVKESSLSEKK